MNEDLKQKEMTFYIKVEVGQHVPSDQGFYATFNYKEITVGMENLQKSIAIGFNSLQDYIRRMTEKNGANSN